MTIQVCAVLVRQVVYVETKLCPLNRTETKCNELNRSRTWPSYASSHIFFCFWVTKNLNFAFHSKAIYSLNSFSFLRTPNLVQWFTTISSEHKCSPTSRLLQSLNRERLEDVQMIFGRKYIILMSNSSRRKQRLQF